MCTRVCMYVYIRNKLNIARAVLIAQISGFFPFFLFFFSREFNYSKNIALYIYTQDYAFRKNYSTITGSMLERVC